MNQPEQGHGVQVDVERYELDEPARYRFELQRRDFMRVFAVMGGGVAVLAGASVSAQESGRGGSEGASTDVSAWLHIGEDGRVRGILPGEPFSEAVISPGKPVRFVLELKRGTADKAGIKDGDLLRHPAIDATSGAGNGG